MPKGPDDGVHQQLELRRPQAEEGAEGRAGDRPQQREKLQPVLREVLEVRRDHLERGAEDRVEAAGHDLGRGRGPELGDDGGVQSQGLGVARFRRTSAGVGAQDGLCHRGDVLLREQADVVAGAHPGLEEPEAGALGASQGLYSGRAGSVWSPVGDRGVGGGRVESVDPQDIAEAAGHLRREGRAQARAHARVGLQDVGDRFHPVRLEELLSRRVGSQRRRHDGVPGRVGRRHQPLEVRSPLGAVRVRADHQAHGLVEHVHLVRLEVLDRARQTREQLAHERLGLAQLLDNKLAPALVADLQESLAGHVLDPRVGLVHELEELVDDGLEKLPVVAEEARVLFFFLKFFF